MAQTMRVQLQEERMLAEINCGRDINASVWSYCESFELIKPTRLVTY